MPWVKQIYTAFPHTAETFTIGSIQKGNDGKRGEQ